MSETHEEKIRRMQGKADDDAPKTLKGERVTSGKNSGPGSVPEIVGITKVLHDPPVYRVRLLGLDGEIELSSYAKLRSYTKFTDLVAEKWDHVFDSKCATWHEQLRQAMARIVHEEPPPDTHVLAVMQEHLNDFLTNRQKGERDVDVLLGHPWEDVENGVHYFRLVDLMRFLAKEDMRGPDGKRAGRNVVAGWIKELGGGDARPMIQGERHTVWWVPSSITRKPQSIEPPRLKEPL